MGFGHGTSNESWRQIIKTVMFYLIGFGLVAIFCMIGFIIAIAR